MFTLLVLVVLSWAAFCLIRASVITDLIRNEFTELTWDVTNENRFKEWDKYWPMYIKVPFTMLVWELFKFGDWKLLFDKQLRERFPKAFE